jgi:hypothetical protein
VESGIVSDDFLVPIVPEMQDVSNAMEVSSLNNPIKCGILLLLHAVKVVPLHRNNWLGLPHEHGVIPILMEERLEPLTCASFL